MPQADLPQDPFAQLVLVHREIEARVAELERASDDTADPARQASALDTIRAVLAYFDGPAALHHADEEETLFPLLRPLAAFKQMLAAFDFQHKMNDTAYAELCTTFRAFTPATSVTLRHIAHRFADLQRGHIIAEERALFPLAVRTLPADAILRIAREMAARRAS